MVDDKMIPFGRYCLSNTEVAVLPLMSKLMAEYDLPSSAMRRIMTA